MLKQIQQNIHPPEKTPSIFIISMRFPRTLYFSPFLLFLKVLNPSTKRRRAPHPEAEDQPLLLGVHSRHVAGGRRAAGAELLPGAAVGREGPDLGVKQKP